MHIFLSVLEFIALSWDGGGGGGGGGGEWVGFGRPQIKCKLCPFTIYSCVMEKGVFMLYFIFHLFRINFLDMPHWILRKISQIM